MGPLQHTDVSRVVRDILLIALVTTLLIMIARTVAAGRRRKPLATEPRDPLHDIFMNRKDQIAQRLSKALQFKTISYDRPDVRTGKGKTGICGAFHDHSKHERKAVAQSQPEVDNTDAIAAYHARSDVKQTQQELLKLHSYLEKEYPAMHAKLRREVINRFSLVFVWRGADPSLQATALYAHMDVVPVDDAPEWAVEPFAGVIKDGFIWGRGAIDDKQAVIGICEAVEHLITAGFTPRRTILLMFGHDEEIGGDEGAAEIVDWVVANMQLKQMGSGVKPKPVAFLLDEGLFVLDGAVPGIKERTACICTAEKGYLNVEMTVEVPGGHASTPPKETAIGILSKALSKLEAKPFPPSFSTAGPVPRMMRHLLPYFALPYRFIFSNLWVFAPLVERILASKPTGATMIRTTTALTIFQAGTKANTLPQKAKAIVNHRIHCAESVQSVLERDRAIIGDERIHFKAMGAVEPSPVSSDTAPAFNILSSAIQDLFVGTVATPALMVGATDSQWSVDIADNIYRHCPTEMHVSETVMFHGRNERIRIENLARICAFYARVIQEADKADL